MLIFLMPRHARHYYHYGHSLHAAHDYFPSYFILPHVAYFRYITPTDKNNDC